MSTRATPVMGHDVLDLVAQAGGAISIDTLRAKAAARFGSEAVYGNCHGQLFSFDELLEFFRAKGKLTCAGSDVALGGVPACSGH